MTAAPMPIETFPESRPFAAEFGAFDFKMLPRTTYLPLTSSKVGVRTHVPTRGRLSTNLSPSAADKEALIRFGREMEALFGICSPGRQASRRYSSTPGKNT